MYLKYELTTLFIDIKFCLSESVISFDISTNVSIGQGSISDSSINGGNIISSYLDLFLAWLFANLMLSSIDL